MIKEEKKIENAGHPKVQNNQGSKVQTSPPTSDVVEAFFASILQKLSTFNESNLPVSATVPSQKTLPQNQVVPPPTKKNPRRGQNQLKKSKKREIKETPNSTTDNMELTLQSNEDKENKENMHQLNEKDSISAKKPSKLPGTIMDRLNEESEQSEDETDENDESPQQISSKRFEEITDQLHQLFPTISRRDWYAGHTVNACGEEVTASGCLVNYYKSYIQDLARAGLIQFKSAKSVAPTNIIDDNDIEFSLKPLTDKDRSLYSLDCVVTCWKNSFDKRIREILTETKNRKITIRFQKYWNTFVCLKSTYGCDLLTLDCDKIIVRLLEQKSITRSVAENFSTIFTTRWNNLSELLCNAGDSSGVNEIKDFRKEHKKDIDQKFFNLRLQEFAMQSDNSNKPPPIKRNQFKEKLNIKYSAAEMLYLTRYFGIIIGDKVPIVNDHWKMYIYLREIVDILMSPRITDQFISVLKEKINSLNSSYVLHFQNLKPKFHFLTHYPSIIEEFGPCIHYWTMRHESRHRDIKANAVASNTHLNLLKTIATKQALKMCQVFDSFEADNNILFGPNIKKNNIHYQQVIINNSEYKVNSFLVISLANPDIQFGKIVSIKKLELKTGEVSVQFELEVYNELFFDKHIMAYVVSKDETSNKKFVKLNDIPSMPPVSAVKKGECYFIIPKYKL
uniref:Uncharacterized protein n=1 Tax=Trichogramma kaykai TaxID=54128 RepID=A0ABD2WZX3_9HYME